MTLVIEHLSRKLEEMTEQEREELIEYMRFLKHRKADKKIEQLRAQFNPKRRRRIDTRLVRAGKDRS